MNREKKEALVAELHREFSENALVVVTRQTGLTVAEVSGLRKRMRDAGCKFKVTKNRLAKIALKDTEAQGLEDMFSGPTAIAVSQDPAAAKVVVEFAKENDKLTVVGAVLDSEIIDIEAVQALAKLPSLDVLQARIVGLLQAPATKIAGVLQAPAGQIARLASAYGRSEA